MKRNYGILKPKLNPKDWRVGGETGIQYKEVLSTGDWTPYLPVYEKQSGNIDDMACVSHSLTDVLEIQFKRAIANNEIPQTHLDWLKNNGYFLNGEVNFSDRALAKMSNTTHQGNWNATVAETARTVGLVPESDWALDFTSWDIFYAEVPAELQKKAAEFLKYFKISYMWVQQGQWGDENLSKENLANWLKVAPLQADVPVCSGWSSGEVQPCGSRVTQHAIAIFKIVKQNCVKILDHYLPFIKNLGWLYPTDWTMLILVEPIVATPAPVVPHYTLTKDLYFGNRNDDVRKLQEELIYLSLLKSGLNTGYYGELTRLAVLAFLKKYSVTSKIWIVINNGKYVGKLTRDKLNNMFK